MRRPSMKQAILAKCHNCCGLYSDGHRDCGVRSCSLYAWMPYRGNADPDLTWEKYNPRRTGLVERSRREISDEKRAKMASDFRARLYSVSGPRSTPHIFGNLLQEKPEQDGMAIPLAGLTIAE